MSVGCIKNGEYKIAAKTGGNKELKDINLYTGNENMYDLLHSSTAISSETIALGTSDLNVVPPEYVIPEDGLYFIYTQAKIRNVNKAYGEALVVSNSYKITINGVTLPAYGVMVNNCTTLNEFLIPLKKGTRIQVSYTHDGNAGNVGWSVELYGFIQQLNQ